MIRKSGRCTAALDIEYFVPDPEHPGRSNHYDILTDSGFLLLWQTSNIKFHYVNCNSSNYVSIAMASSDRKKSNTLCQKSKIICIGVTFAHAS
jgi:hypothetical protein